MNDWRTKHGLSHTLEYAAWRAMRSRCTDPRNKRFYGYGGRGIRVCPEWDVSFVAFISDMGRRPSSQHSLDRIDNDGNYEPGNCRWATRKEQDANRGNLTLMTWNGETKSVTAWAEVTGLPKHTIYVRVWRGWPADRALSTPNGGKGGHSARRL